MEHQPVTGFGHPVRAGPRLQCLLSVCLDGRLGGDGNQLQTAKIECSHRFRRVRDAERDRLGSRLDVECALDRRHFIRLVPKDPFGHRHRVADLAVTTADLHVLSNGAGFSGVVKGDFVIPSPVDLDFPGHLSAARPTEAVPGLPPEAIVPGGRSAAVQGYGGVPLDRHRGRPGLGSPRKGDEDSEYKKCRLQPHDLLLGCHSPILSESGFTRHEWQRSAGLAVFLGSARVSGSVVSGRAQSGLQSGLFPRH